MVALGADHGGFALKEEIKEALERLGFPCRDLGTFSTEPVDYPDLALAVARAVRGGEAAAGILVDGAGIGSSMAANKVPGVRAALCVNAAAAKNAREHNDANVLTLGAGFVDAARAQEIVAAFLAARCTEERHLRRVAKITAIEESFKRVTDPRLVEAVVRAVMAQLGTSEAPCACHSVAGGCCPDRMGRLLGHGAERFGLQADADLYPREIARLIDHTLLKPDATPRPDRDAVRGGAHARVRERLREPGLGAAVRGGAARLRDEGVHRGRLPAGRDAAPR